MIRRLDWLTPWALLIATLAAFLARAQTGIGQTPFGDESGHLIGAHAIMAGDRLYRDFIDAHGPVAFIVPWLYDLVFGWSHANGVRWTMVLLAAAALIAVIRSPIYARDHSIRLGGLWAGAIFIGALASVWTVQGLSLVSYHTMAGCFTVVILAVFAGPGMLGVVVGPRASALAGACSLLCCATAYPLVPSMALLLLGPLVAMPGDASALRRCSGSWALGFAAAGVLVLAWMLVHGDLVGYFVFHFLTLQANYARYAPATVAGLVASLRPSGAPGALVHAMALLAVLVGIALYLPTRRWRLRTVAGFALTLAGILLLDARGLVTFQDGTFVMAAIAWVALPTGLLLVQLRPRAAHAIGLSVLVAVGLLLVEKTARSAVDTPWGRTRAEAVARADYDLNIDRRNPVFAMIRRALDPGERMAALVYSPTIFLNAGVLPIRRFHEYLPWEADYARHPMFGRTRDLCATVMPAPPPVLWFDDWTVAGRYPPASFIPCLPNLLTSSYARDATTSGLFVRRDRVDRARAAGFIPAGSEAGFGQGATRG